MGFIRKKTGVQAEIDTAQRNAQAQEAATQQAARDQQAALMQTAKAAADQQAAIAAREAAMAQAEDVVSAPLETAEVQVAASTPAATGARRKRRASFGYGSTGVQI